MKQGLLGVGFIADLRPKGRRVDVNVCPDHGHGGLLSSLGGDLFEQVRPDLTKTELIGHLT
jgi:hypothetical protein